MSETYEPAHGTLTRYVYGCRGEECNGACPAASARYEKLRAWDLANGRPRTVSNLGCARRIRALGALGWPMKQIATLMGWSCPQALYRAIAPGGKVYTATHERVKTVYEDLSMSIGPSEIARRRAAKKGWPPPLCWTDIDDPDEKPTRGLERDTEADPVVVQRILAGDILPANRAERTEIIRRWPRTGLPLNELQRRFPQWNLWRDLKQIEKEAA